MLIYLRKITNNDTRRQIETTIEAYTSFFGGDVDNVSGVNVVIENNDGTITQEFRISKAAGAANSYRFSSAVGGQSFGNFIKQITGSNYNTNDIIQIVKDRNKYKLSLIKTTDDVYLTLDLIMKQGQTTIVIADDTDSAHFDTNKEINIHTDDNNSREVLSLDVRQCAKKIIDTIHNIDNFSRLRDSFVVNDKSIKIDISRIDGLEAEGNLLRYIFIRPGSDIYSPKNNQTIRVFQDKTYKFNNEDCLLTNQWEGSNDSTSNSLKALIEVVNLRYAGIVEIKEIDGIKYLIIFADIPYNTQVKLLNSNDDELARNRIVFGAPGTGKSFKIQEDCKFCLKKFPNNFERVTFHPDYSYAQFVGTYKPVSVDSKIMYHFVPGPFMRILTAALKSAKSGVNAEPYVLILEEINRAMVAAVFGDVFQLLDRDKNGVSVYSIQTSEDMRTYLSKELNINSCSEIKLPNNLYIWATMNSADQGVFPMDTAFKRRWDFEYIGIDDAQDKIEKYTIPIGVGNAAKRYNWNDVRKIINKKLTECDVNEDKLLGPFFISKNMLDFAQNEDNRNDFIKFFKDKVIMYLFEDVMKHKPNKLFVGCEHMIYSEICASFDKYGLKIFGVEND